MSRAGHTGPALEAADAAARTRQLEGYQSRESTSVNAVILYMRTLLIHTLGMTRKWTGACGLMSRKASALSSSNMMSAEISFEMILSKIVGAPSSAFLSSLQHHCCMLFPRLRHPGSCTCMWVMYVPRR